MTNTMKKFLFLFAIIFPLAFSAGYSQELDARVIVNMEQVAVHNRVNVETLQNDLERYLNTQRFTDIDWEGPKIPVEVSVYLTGGMKGVYGARLFIVAKRYIDGPKPGTSVTLKFVDDKWTFEYNRGANLSYNPMRFNQMTSLIDYYMLIIIGYDSDTYAELSGTPIYEKAKQICQLGATAGADGYSTYSMPGEMTRYNLISELVDLRFEEFRQIVFSYFVDGLDMMAFEPEKGMKAVKQAIFDLAYFKENKLAGPSVLMQVFFDSKAQEFADMFRGQDDPELFRTLRYLDPGNTLLYEESEAGR